MMTNRRLSILTNCIRRRCFGRASRFAVIFALALAFCVKVKLYDTDHPEHGKITLLNLDWSNRGEGIEVPDEYTFSSAHATTDHGYTATMAIEESAVDHYFPAGQHRITVLNAAENIAVDLQQNSATANYQAGELGWFFSGSATANIVKAKEHVLNVSMQQRVRELRLELKIEGRARSSITAIEANLSGIAQTISLTTGLPVGGAVSVTPVFSTPDCSYPTYCISTASLRLLGVTGSVQTLSLMLHFDDGTVMALNSNLSEPLKTFNDDRSSPLVLYNSLTVDSPRFTATINQWYNSNSGDLIAD